MFVISFTQAIFLDIEGDNCDVDDDRDENQLEWQNSPKKSIILCTNLKVVIWIYFTNRDKYLKWFECL